LPERPARTDETRAPATMNDIPEEITAPADEGAPVIEEAQEPLQTPSTAEVSSMPVSGKKLFIGNLSYAWTDEELRAFFAEQGTVTTAEVARFRGRGGRSRGFGFVEMTTETEAQGAIEKLHGAMAGGRQIIVRLAKSQENRPPSVAPGTDEPTAQTHRSRHQAPSSSRSGRGPSRSRTNRSRNSGGGRMPSSAPSRSYKEVDFVNKSGYEIFPRGARANSEPSTPSSSHSSGSPIEASPYMDDTGDIENHGRRPPGRHRRRH